MPLVGGLVGLVDPVIRKRRVGKLDNALVVRMGEALLRHVLGHRSGLVQLIENNQVRRHSLLSSIRLTRLLNL
jgi:hypothetical protein